MKPEATTEEVTQSETGPPAQDSNTRKDMNKIKKGSQNAFKLSDTKEVLRTCACGFTEEQMWQDNCDAFVTDCFMLSFCSCASSWFQV